MGLFGKKTARPSSAPPRDSGIASVRWTKADPRASGRNTERWSAVEEEEADDAMPEHEELDEQMREMLEKQGQKPQVVEQIMLLDDEKKWMMLQGYRKTQQTSAVRKQSTSIDSYKSCWSL